MGVRVCEREREREKLMKKKASLPPPLCDAFEEEEEKKIQSLRIDRADDRWSFFASFFVCFEC